MISVGVDIGTYSIKVADLESTSKGYVIRRVQEFPLSLDLTKDRKIEIIDTLRTLFAQYPADSTHFVFGISQKYISARLVNFPFRERFKIQKSVASQLEDELPFSQDDAIFDIKTVRYMAKASDVIAMAVPKERVSDVIDLAHDCGVKPTLVSGETMGLANLFEDWTQPPPDTGPFSQELPTTRPAELVVNLGHSSSQILVYVEGLLSAVRNVDWGARNISDAIGQKYGLNYIQGMRELQTKGFILLDKSQGTREQIAFSEVIEESVQGLISEMRLKMFELQSEMNLEWSKGRLTGGTAQLKNLGAYLTQAFQIPFNRYKQFENQSLQFESNLHLELVSPVAVGLAIEALRRPRNPATNFLRDEFAQQSRYFESLWEKWGYTAQLLGSAFVILLVYSMVRSSLTETLVQSSDDVMHKQAQAIAGIKKASASKVRGFIKAQEKMEHARKDAEKVSHMNSALDILDMISSALPARQKIGLEIKRVQIDNDQADVHGYTNSSSEKEQVAKILKGLSTNGKAEGINIRIPIPAGKVGFAYRVQVNRISGG